MASGQVKVAWSNYLYIEEVFFYGGKSGCCSVTHLLCFSWLLGTGKIGKQFFQRVLFVVQPQEFFSSLTKLCKSNLFTNQLI